MLTSMDWLEAAPKDFKEQLRALQRDRDARPRGEVAAAMAALANHVLDENQLVKLARLAKEFLAGGGAEPLVSLKLGVFGDGTLSLITPVIARIRSTPQAVDRDLRGRIQPRAARCDRPGESGARSPPRHGVDRQ